MSTRTRSASSIYTRGAKRRTAKTQPTQSMRDTSSVEYDPEVVASSSSSSPLRKVFESEEFRAEWDNAVALRVATYALQLRRLRGYSQAHVAKLMETSQPKVARIEGGDDNITLRTLRKLALALQGRIRLSIEPREVHVPAMPEWWEAASCGLASEKVWRLRGVAEAPIGREKAAGVVWSTEHEVRSVDRSRELSLLADGSIA